MNSFYKLKEAATNQNDKLKDEGILCDEVHYGDYKYLLGYTKDGSPFYHVKVLDKTFTHYGKILSHINGVKVTSMHGCFFGCKYLKTPPAIPSSIENMFGCFFGCTSLEEPPIIPEGVKDMSGCFGECESLRMPPVIPDSVNFMDDCFRGCTFEYDYENRCMK